MHPKHKTLGTVVLVVALVAAAAFSTVTAMKYTRQNETLRTSIDQQKASIEKREIELRVARKALSDAESATAVAGRTCAAQQDQRKQTLDAFSKQAGACETLRKKMNVSGYTS